jgi:hypothetical protein
MGQILHGSATTTHHPSCNTATGGSAQRVGRQELERRRVVCAAIAHVEHSTHLTLFGIAGREPLRPVECMTIAVTICDGT